LTKGNELSQGTVSGGHNRPEKKLTIKRIKIACSKRFIEPKKKKLPDETTGGDKMRGRIMTETA